MAKDTEKLIRQLSLISYLMAERRPVTAPEIRRDVEGYSVMNEDAFARRFYADRSELEALGIALAVEKPVDGLVEQENYSLPPENFHLPPIAFTDQELAALQTALQLLDGEFAYAEPLRLALQQISWGRPSPLSRPEQSTVALGITGSAGGHEVSARLAKIETAIFRRKTIVFEYHTMERDDVGTRKVDPYQLLYQGGQFYLVGRSHERAAIRVFRLSRIQGKVTSIRARTPTGSAGSSATRSVPRRWGSPTGSPGRSSATSDATARCAQTRIPPCPRTVCSSLRTPTHASSSRGSSGSARTRGSPARRSC
jgi:predicted DNA-binding transcriptional regulator YafY